jgi:hypothetical protein
MTNQLTEQENTIMLSAITAVAKILKKHTERDASLLIQLQIGCSQDEAETLIALGVKYNSINGL